MNKIHVLLSILVLVAGPVVVYFHHTPVGLIAGVVLCGIGAVKYLDSSIKFRKEERRLDHG